MLGRYYDPATEQFLSVDPMVDETGTPYAFTEGDPVNENDPNGFCGVGQVLSFWNSSDRNCWSSGYSNLSNNTHLQFQPGQGARGAADFAAGLANSAVSTVDAGISQATYDQINPDWQISEPFNDPGSFEGLDSVFGDLTGDAEQFLSGVCPLIGDALDAAGILRGGELRFGNNFRINPLGDDDSDNPFGRRPHYHSRGPGGIKAHRPWE